MTDVEWSIGFRHPCTIQISGHTGCGKTRLVRQILENRLIEQFPSRILWEYGEWQDDYEQFDRSTRILSSFMDGVRSCTTLFEQMKLTYLCSTIKYVKQATLSS